MQQETEYALQQHNVRTDRLIQLLVKACDKDQPAVAVLVAASPSQTPVATREPDPVVTLELSPGVSLECVCIPAGPFLMGSDRAKGDQAFDDELPQHSVTLPDFYIGKTPATNAQFEAFVKTSSYKTLAEKEGHSLARNVKDGTWARAPGYTWRTPLGPTSSISERREHPVIHVSWHDAIAFCAWLSQASGRTIALPSEAEWEKAGRGTERRIYPWGDQAPTDKLCNFNNNISETTPVGRYSPAGDCSYGCVDMAAMCGNGCAACGVKTRASPSSHTPTPSGRRNVKIRPPETTSAACCGVVRGSAIHRTSARLSTTGTPVQPLRPAQFSSCVRPCSSRCVIWRRALGDPGSGKTTLLRFLALLYAREQAETRKDVQNTLGLTESGLLRLHQQIVNCSTPVERMHWFTDSALVFGSPALPRH